MGMTATPGKSAASIPSPLAFRIALKSSFFSVNQAKKKLLLAIKNLAKKTNGQLERALITIHRSCG
jgi:hypothetical protein